MAIFDNVTNIRRISHVCLLQRHIQDRSIIERAQVYAENGSNLFSLRALISSEYEESPSYVEYTVVARLYFSYIFLCTFKFAKNKKIKKLKRTFHFYIVMY